jgi:hypothetical protein
MHAVDESEIDRCASEWPVLAKRSEVLIAGGAIDPRRSAQRAMDLKVRVDADTRASAERQALPVANSYFQICARLQSRVDACDDIEVVHAPLELRLQHACRLVARSAHGC